MKKIICLLFISLIFSNCNDESKDSDILSENNAFKKVKKLPDLSNIVLQNHFNRNKIQKVVDSIAKDWKGVLEFVIQDKGLIKINEKGLYLQDYELIDDRDLLNTFLKAPLSENSYLPIYEIGNNNNFKILQPYKTSGNSSNLDEKNRLINEGLEGYLKHLGKPEIFIVKLNWKYKNKLFSNNAIFTSKRLIYNETLSNLRLIKFNIQKEKDSEKNP